jgi:hypothetical protein
VQLLFEFFNAMLQLGRLCQGFAHEEALEVFSSHFENGELFKLMRYANELRGD